MGSKRKRQMQDVPATAPALKKHQKAPKPSNSPPQAAAPAPPAPFVEEPRGAELKREVQLYEKLSSENAPERLQAADAVVSGLLGGDQSVSEATLQRHLERRLFRGLASGRKGARLGFSVVLTELLSQLYGDKPLSEERYVSLPFDKVLEILKSKTKPDGDLSGQEERDHALGLLFGLQSFVRAKILFVEGQSRWETVLDALIQLARKKPWMREECGWVIVETLEQMNQVQAEKTIAKLQEAMLAASPEGVGVWLTARRKFPDMKFPSKPWGHGGNPLEHLKSLAIALKESSIEKDVDRGDQVQPTGNWNHHLHFAWNIVIDHYIQDARSGSEEMSSEFSNFWKVAVDENLFSTSASTERKFWGFLVFQKMLKEASQYPHILRHLFSKNLMRCLINQLSKEDRFLHRAAEKSLKVLQHAIETTPAAGVTILQMLIGENGVYNFDQVTKTKTIDKLLSCLDGDDAGRATTIFVTYIMQVKSSESDKDAEAPRQIYGDYMLSMIRQNYGDKSKDRSWVRTVALPELALFAYSKIGTLTPPMSEKSRNIFKSRLSSALAIVVSDEVGCLYPCEVLQNLKPSAVDMDDDILAAKDKALAVMDKLIKKGRKGTEQEKKPLQALAVLYALIIFQLYNGEPDALSLLDELKLCYDKLIRGKNTTDSDSEASVVLVEILLSFMSKSSILLRKIAQQVFTAFSGEITEEGVKALIEVLESSESVKGQSELFDHDEDDERQEEDSYRDDELDSDVEVVDVNDESEDGSGNRLGGDDDEIDDDDDDDDDDEDEEEEEEEEGIDDLEAQKLDDALAKALGTHRADKDLDEVPSDSDADMSDSEMMALDSKLVEIFSQRKKAPNKKKEKKDARENIVNFKSRVLDLVEIFVKEQATNPLAFDLLIPMLKLMRITTAKHLSEKAHKIITTFAKASKNHKAGENEAELDLSKRVHVLKEIHEEASKDPSHAFAKAASSASLLIATTLYRDSKSHVKKIATVYRDTQVRWVDGGGKIQASFFHDWINWCQSHVA